MDRFYLPKLDQENLSILKRSIMSKESPNSPRLETATAEFYHTKEQMQVPYDFIKKINCQTHSLKTTVFWYPKWVRTQQKQKTNGLTFPMIINTVILNIILAN